MNETQDSQKTEFIAYSLNNSAIQEISTLNKPIYSNIELLRIMHSPNLKFMNGLEKFTYLKEINLASNNIEKMNCLQNLTELRILNLSCNKIKNINCLNGLNKLEKLIISHNKISNIQNLSQLNKDENNLIYLDLSDNNIQELDELLVLNNLKKLQNLIFEHDQDSNPICKNKGIYYKSIRNLNIFENLMALDGHSPDTLINYNFPDKLNENYEEKQKKRYISPENKKKSLLNLEKKSEKKQLINNEINMDEEDIKIIYEKKINEIEEINNEKIKNFTIKIEELTSEQKSLVYKLEMNDVFWTSKYEKIEKELIKSVLDTKEFQSQLKKSQKDLNVIKSEIFEIKQENTDLKQKQLKKDELIDNLQFRMSQLLKENSENQRNFLVKSEELEKIKQELRISNESCNELRVSLRSNEKLISDFHAKSLENATFSLNKGEEIKRKYEELVSENKEFISQNSDLKQKNSELLELIHEWELKYERKILELKEEFEISFKKKEKILIENQNSQINNIKNEKEELENEYKDNLDLLENEFRKVLTENSEKFKILKSNFEEKIRSENELKNLLKITIAKNTENERLINDFQIHLLEIRKEVSEISTEKELLQKELNLRNNLQFKENALINEEKEKNEKEKKQLEENLNKINEIRNKELSETEKIKEKIKKTEYLQKEIEDLKFHIETKTKILEDKNETIENLKEELEILKTNENQYNENFKKILKKNEQQKSIIEELETQISDYKEEKNELNQKLEEKTQLISLIEQELIQIRQTQSSQINQLKSDNLLKDQKIQELILKIDDFNLNVKKKDEKINEIQNELMQMIELIDSKEMENTYKIKQKDKEISNLSLKLSENEEELKILIREIENQKKLAKENISKLTRIFNI